MVEAPPLELDSRENQEDLPFVRADRRSQQSRLREVSAEVATLISEPIVTNCLMHVRASLCCSWFGFLCIVLLCCCTTW